jgi:hypothetical protein
LSVPRVCYGLHVALPQPGCRPITWLRESHRTTRVRVQQHTCEWCSRITYELCAAGGLMFIRRTNREMSVPVVSETEHLVARRTFVLWTWLIGGQVR